jgi:hypothetical protein
VSSHAVVYGVTLASLAALVVPASGLAQSAEAAPATSTTAPTDSVRIGCSGGHTGLGLGNTLTRDGHLASYRRPLGKPTEHTALRRDTTAAARVFLALERIRFRTIRFSEIGNMTCYLEQVDGTGSHEVNWVIEQPPPELEPVLAELRRAFGDDRRMWP